MNPLDLIRKATKFTQGTLAEASPDNLKQFPQQLLALNDLVQQTKQEQKESTYPNLKSSDPQKRQAAEMMAMGQDAAVGASLGTSAPFAIKGKVAGSAPTWKQEYAQNVVKKPRTTQEILASVKGKTVEQLAEKSGGWANAGDRAKFDTAMINMDVKTIKDMLPRVPESYLHSGFGQQAFKTLMLKQNPTKYFKLFADEATPNIPAFNAANMPDATTRILSDQITKPNVAGKILDWFYK